MTCQPGNLSTNHLNATISGNDFSCPVMLLEDHGRYMRRFADCVFPSLFGLCRLAIYPAIAFTAQPQRTGNRMRFTVNIGAHFCRRELFFIWLMLPLSGGVIEKCAAADKDTKKSWAAIVKPLPASLYPGRTGIRPHASPVPESSMLQWPPVLTTSKTHAEVPSRQQESSEATVRTHPQRRPDRKRQYYRNPSAERFDQQIEALANEVNQLKKQLHGPHRESHKTALLDLAFQMTERDPHPLRASPKALALLANAFSKLAKYQEGATALDWIMKAVIHRSQKQQLTKQCGFKAQTLAMVLNSLSQVAGDKADTTRKALAKEVGSRDLTDPREWSAQHLAMVTNGLSQVAGDDADTTRKALAKEVGRRALAGDLKCWIAQELAMVTNGLSQVKGDDADTTRKALAKEVGRRDLTDTKEWSAQHLAMVTNGLSQVTGDDADTTRKALAKEVGRRALAGDLKCWIAQDLAMVTNGLSQVAGDDADTTRKALAKEVGSRDLTATKEWSAQPLAMVTNGLSQVAGDDADTTRKALAKEVGSRDLTDTKEWSAKHLAMVTNGLSQVWGDDADTTRKALAKEVGIRDLTNTKEWSAQHLAMVTNGLGPVAGDDADTTRKALAKEVGSRDLTDTKEWSAQPLAMVTNGLSQVAGDDADTTRKALAKEVGSRDLTDTKEWSAQPLAMVTNGLSQVRGDDADTTRKALAKEVGSRDLTDTKEWSAQHLAMVTNGLSQVTGDDADTTRKALAKEVGSRDLTDTKEWSAQPLAMVASGMSHCSHVIGADVVQASIQAIMNISPTEQDIIMALDALCRLSLSDDQLKLAYFLVKRLCDMTGFIDTGSPLQQSVGDVLWNLAVLDLCAKQNPLVKDDPDTPRFDIFVKPLMDRESIRDVLSHHWQDRFAYIYWAGISNLEIDVSPALSAPEKKVKVSASQNRVFQAVKNALPNQNIVMEVNIEGFPVDILVGKTLCIEVDGPHHYIQDDTMENDELLLAKESGKRRARDPLIDHILKSLGFEVLRISYVETDSVAGLGTFVDRVINAMDEQEMSRQYEGLRVNDLPAW